MKLKARNKTEKRIIAYLESDKTLTEYIEKCEDENLDNCMEYCSDQAKEQTKQGVTYACVEDEVVYSWCKDYFMNWVKPEPKPVITPKPIIEEHIEEDDDEPDEPKTKPVKQTPKQLSLFDLL